MTSVRALCGAIAGALLVAGPSAAHAQAWPTRAMQVISPFTAGNANDIVGRVVLDQVSRQLGQPVVIENKPGGGGSIGAAEVAKAEPDGYTILLHSSSVSSQVLLHKTLPFDPLRDFAPVVLFGIQPSVLVAAPGRVTSRSPILSPPPRPSPASSTSPPPASAPLRTWRPSGCASPPSSTSSTSRSAARSRRSPR
jgi:tripartite-type tricarboxylate transporter receptor subunit TctC